MSNNVPCQALTRRGRPCRNAALPHSDPPRCARHAVPPAPVAVVEPVATQPRLPGMSDEELDALEEECAAPGVERELQVVRLVLRRLFRLMNDPEQPPTPEEARRLAAVVFSGTRTVAYLLNQRAGAGAGGQEWLKRALEALAVDYDLDL